jgi:hypothetical protein
MSYWYCKIEICHTQMHFTSLRPHSKNTLHRALWCCEVTTWIPPEEFESSTPVFHWLLPGRLSLASFPRQETEFNADLFALQDDLEKQHFQEPVAFFKMVIFTNFSELENVWSPAVSQDDVLKTEPSCLQPRAIEDGSPWLACAFLILLYASRETNKVQVIA